MLSNADLPYPTIKLSTGETVRLDAGRVHPAPAGARARRSRQGVRGVLRRAQDLRAHHGGDAGGGGEGAPVREARPALRHGAARRRCSRTTSRTAVYKQLLADVHRSLPTLHRYLTLRKRMLGLGRPPLPGSVRAAGGQRRHALRSPTRRGPSPSRRWPRWARRTPSAAQGLRQPLDRLPAVDRASARARTRPASTACTRISC